MSVSDSILVIGHRNPDMDAIASAVGYAWVLSQRAANGVTYMAARTGTVNAQTEWALKRFNSDAPALVTDVRARVGDIVEALPSLQKGQNILSACQSIARTRRPAPLLDEAQKPIGLLTGEGLFAALAEALSSTSVLALAKEFDVSAEMAIDPNGVILSLEEFIRDIINQVLRSDQDDFIVVDSEGRYTGLARKSSLLSPPRRKIVLVDHNELAQAIPGLEEAEVVEVLDHHRLNSVPTAVPIRFTIDPVGSCSTLVTEHALEDDRVLPPHIAGLLLCGILSDTLIFRSPTATNRDVTAAQALAHMSELVDDSADSDAVSAAVEQLGQELLGSGAGLGTRPADDLINTDIKFYEVGALRAGIAQVEVTSFSEIASRLSDLQEALQTLMTTQKLALALLMITDVVRGSSRLMVVGQPRIITSLPYAHLSDELLDAPGMMSRKKQLLPVVLAALTQAA